MEVSDKDQRPEDGGDGEPEDPMGHVECLECGRGDDDEHLLLCDGAALTARLPAFPPCSSASLCQASWC